MLTKKYSANYFICCFLLLVILNSCSSKKDAEHLMIQEMNATLENSNALLYSKINATIFELKGKAEKPETKEKGEIWLPKTLAIDSISKISIKQLGERIKLHETIDIADLDTIFAVLLEYQTQIFNIDKYLNEDLKKTITSTLFTDTIYSNEDSFINKFQLIKLTQFYSMFQSKILQVDAMATEWCNKQVGSSSDWFWNYDNLLISQNSTHFKPNDNIEITAGLGVYSSIPKPKIFINNKEVQLIDNAIAIKKLKVSDKVGKHYIPIEIYFNSFYKGRDTVRKEIEYIVE